LAANRGIVHILERDAQAPSPADSFGYNRVAIVPRERIDVQSTPPSGFPTISGRSRFTRDRNTRCCAACDIVTRCRKSATPELPVVGSTAAILPLWTIRWIRGARVGDHSARSV